MGGSITQTQLALPFSASTLSFEIGSPNRRSIDPTDTTQVAVYAAHHAEAYYLVVHLQDVKYAHHDYRHSRFRP